MRKVGYWEIVNTASEALALGSKAVQFSWKLCSGIAHGGFWTTINAAERVELPGTPPGMGSFQITANVKILMYATTFPAHMTRTAGASTTRGLPHRTERARPLTGFREPEDA